MKRGFALVELSIVLVIIGLLIGGILVARSMIETSHIQSQIKQFQQYDIALQNFWLNYKQLPGDCNNTLCPHNNSILTNGGTYNNGYLESNLYPNNFPPSGYYTELYKFFADLSDLEVIKESYTVNLTDYNAANIYSGIGKTVPAAAIGRGGMLVDQSAAGIWWIMKMGIDKTTGDWNWSRTTTPMFTVSEALALDTKLDDGLPSNGKVVTVLKGGRSTAFGSSVLYDNYYPLYFDNNTNTCVTTANSGNTYTPNTTDTYNAAGSGVICDLQVLSGFEK